MTFITIQKKKRRRVFTCDATTSKTERQTVKHVRTLRSVLIMTKFCRNKDAVIGQQQDTALSN